MYFLIYGIYDPLSFMKAECLRLGKTELPASFTGLPSGSTVSTTLRSI